MLALRPIVVNADHVVLGGNMRLKACQAAGLKEVPVIVADHLTPDQQREFIIKDNVGFGEWDWNELANAWDAQQLTDWGLDIPDFETAPAEGNTDPDEVPEAPVEPVSKLGDLWLLGKHRVLCGDSTQMSDVERLMNQELADVVFTDPPYALFGNSTGINGVADDKMIRPFFRSILMQCRMSSKNFAHVYVCCDWHSAFVIESISREVELTPKNLIVWDKGDGGIGAMYQNCHELVWFFGNKPTLKHTTNKMSGERPVNGKPNIWRYGRVTGADRQHNAAKPVDMVAFALENSANRGAIALDLFLGSGTTIIAAETQGMACYGMEMEPKYVDVIVKRWQDFTKQQAVHADTGQPFGAAA